MRIRSLIAVAILLLCQLAHSQSPTLIDLIDARPSNPLAPDIATDEAKEDLTQLESSIRAGYGYLEYYEKRWNIKLAAVIAQKKLDVDTMTRAGKISHADFRALVSEVVSSFRDAHEWISPEGDEHLSLNIGLTYGEAEGEYLMYKGNFEIYKQLGLNDLAEFQKGEFKLTAVNDIAMRDVAKAMYGVLPYSNSLTRKSYAGILLSSSKGLLYLASLMKRGKFPVSGSQIRLTVVSTTLGIKKEVLVSPQTMSDWRVDDLIGKIEGRSPRDRARQRLA